MMIVHFTITYTSSSKVYFDLFTLLLSKILIN